jgi:hypothetical protein
VTTNYITSKLLRNGSDSAAYNYEVINNIVKRMDTMLKTPETVFCKQDEDLTKENDQIYFIAKGKCDVIVQDKFTDRFEQKTVRVLEPGMHFGVSKIL